jgi:5-amino-6-(5-phosphoribosylamino)uracil reductase
VDRPYVLLSCAMSLDGYIDDARATRLVLSGEQDLDRVDEVRAGCDAILVGAGTIRADDPGLVLRSQHRRQHRIATGLSPGPAKVTLTNSGDLDPSARFFTAGDADRLVFAASAAAARVRCLLGASAQVIDAGNPADLRAILASLAGRGIARLMVEGGKSVFTQFLTAGLADELQLAVAPFLVGDSAAPRFGGDGTFPWTSEHPARLTEVRQVGNDALLRYALSDRYTPSA